MKVYNFDLMLKGQVLDSVQLDENNPEHAMEVFLNEFGWAQKLTKESQEEACAVLFDIEEEND